MTTTPVGWRGEFIVNTTRTGDQTSPAVAALHDGGYVVVWTDAASDGSGTSIRAIVCAANGNAAVGDFLVNTTTAGDQVAARVTVLADGNFVVTWADGSASLAGDSRFAVRAQIFTPEGTPIGDEILVWGGSNIDQFEPDVVARPDGGFTVAFPLLSDESSSVYVSHFTSSGTRIISGSLISQLIEGGEFPRADFQVALAISPTGTVMAVWTEMDEATGDGALWSVKLRRITGFDWNYEPAIIVNTTTAGYQYQPAVASLGAAGFVVVWTDGSQTGGDTASWAIRGQLFNWSGVPVGDEFLVNTSTAGAQNRADVTALADGGFVVSWSDQSLFDTNNTDTLARRFDAAGNPVGVEFRVNTFTDNAQSNADSALLSDGRFIVAWQDGSGVSDISGYGIHLAIGDPRGGVQAGAALVQVTGAAGVDVVGGLEATLGAGAFAAGTSGRFTVTAGTTVVTFYGYGVTYAGDTPASGTVTNFRMVVDGVQVAIGSNMTMDVDALVAAASAAAGGDLLPLRAIFDDFGYRFVGAAGPDVLSGQGFGDTFVGGGGNDVVDGAGGNDTATGGAGDDTVAGGGGDDLAIYAGNWRDYTITGDSGAGFTLADRRGGAPDGLDHVESVERFRFADGTLTAGQLINFAATDLALTGTAVVDRAGGGTLVGRLSSNDPNTLDALTYTLVDDPSGYFEIVGDALRVRAGAVVDLAAGAEWDVTIAVADAGGLGHTEIVTLTVVPPLQAWGPEFGVGETPGAIPVWPSIAALSNGDFVVVHQDYSGAGAEAGTAGIRAQLFRSDGSAAGAGFAVNTTVAGAQGYPAVSALEDGGWVAVWRDATGRYDNAYGQIFNADGTPRGGEFLLGAAPAPRGGNVDPAVVGLADGNFVAAWSTDGESGSVIAAQLFGPDGARIGTEFVVGPEDDSTREPAIAALDDGGFAVAWRGLGGGDIGAQVFGADGLPSGAELVVNAETVGSQAYVRLATLTGGRLVAVWTDFEGSGGDGSFSSVKGRVYDLASGTWGPEFLVNTTTTGRQEIPFVAALDGGGFVVTWFDYASGWTPGGIATIRGQVFDSAGARVGAEFDAETEQASRNSVIAVLPDGRFVVAFDVGNGSADYAVRARIFDPRTAGVTLPGSTEVDQYFGTPYVDVLSGDTGNDTMKGGGGADSLYGGEGNDRFDEAADGAADTMNGGYGDDFYILREAGEIVDENSPGTAGLDTVWVSFTDYTLTTGTEVGAVNFAGPAILTGEGDRNTLFGEASQDTLFGLGGSDYLYGFGADDTLYGGLGPDFLYGGSGNDTLVGGEDNDYYRLDDGGADTIVEAVGEGIDQVWVNFSGHTLQANIEWGVLNFDTAGDLTGNAIDNTLYGTDGVNTLMGGGGNDNLLGYAGIDALHGEDGDDVLQGGLDADTLYGGSGNDAFIGGGGAGNTYFGGVGDDFYRVDAAGDVVSEVGGSGIDTVWVSVTVDYVAPDGIENLAANIGTALNLTGNGLDNLIQGNDALNTLSGAGGNDTLIAYDGADVLAGGAGRDILIGGGGADTFAYSLGDGDDIIVDFNFADGDRVDLTGISYIGNGATADVAILSADGGVTTFTLSANNGYNWTGAEFI
ncbi:MAG: calcium-binding protein [Rhodospirillales bacterium]|nr:MAG: calcium-binding protein [Rhodospirillales bacterium]